MLDLYETVPFRLYIASQSKKGMPTAGYFFVSFFKVNPRTLLDLLVCVQPAPQVNYDMQRYQLPSLFQASPGPNKPLHRSASKVPIHHFQTPKMMTRLLLSDLGSFPPSWPNPTDTSLFSSHAAVSSFLEHARRLAFVSLSWLSESQQIFPSSPLLPLSPLCFTCDCYSGLSSILPLFLPPFLPSFSEYARPRWSHHSQCLILWIC